MWDSEQKFSHYLTDRLKKEGFVCNRIETHGTLNGMPDMFVQGNGMDTFIELKNMKKASVNDGKWKIPWRPGQLAWAAVYRNSHHTCYKDVDMYKVSWTLIGCSDGILAIPMNGSYLLNTVTEKDTAYVIGKGDRIRDILGAHSQLAMPALCPGERRMYDFLEDIARAYCCVFAGSVGIAEADVDWPDREVLAQSIGISSKELSGFAPADYNKCRIISAMVASVVWSCWDSYRINNK